MIKSKKLLEQKKITHGFFNKIGGKSNGIYKSLNCGLGSNDKKNKVKENLKIVKNKICKKSKNIFLLHQIHSKKLVYINKNFKLNNQKIIGDAIITDQKKLPISSIKFNDDVLAWAANENSKNRFKSNINLWTLQATLRWSKKTINKYKNDKSIMNQLITRFIKLTGFEKNKIIFKRIHGWKYSYNYEKTSYLSIWNKKINLGVCGDWFNGPKVENAWLSANDLARKIK